MALLNGVHALRSSYGPSVRMDVLSRELGLSESFLSTSFTRICELCDCRQIDHEVDPDRLTDAVKRYFRSINGPLFQPGQGSGQSGPSGAQQLHAQQRPHEQHEGLGDFSGHYVGQPNTAQLGSRYSLKA